MKTISKLEWISGMIFLILGIGCLVFPVQYAEAFFYVIAGLMTASAIGFLVEAVLQKRMQFVLMALVCALGAGFLWFQRMYSRELIGLVFSFYIFFNFAVEGIQTILDFRDHTHDRWEHLLMSGAYLVLWAFSIGFRRHDIRFIMYYIGIYLLLQAVETLGELYFIRHPHTSRTYNFDHWVALPVYVVTLLPFWILSAMNRKLTKNPGAKVPYDERKNDLPVNLRVFIHSGLKGDHRVGHMTFAYKGLMYSYGNYDTAEEKFFRTIGPGIFFTAPADIYINNCCIYEGSTLFEFGLHLSEESEQELVSTLKEVLKDSYRWYSPIEVRKDGWRDFEQLKHDYACRLSYYTGAKFRKFSCGQWKTYWVMGDNCSLFAESILSKIGREIVHKTGIVTPGEYFQYFEEAYADPKSNVVYRSWHDAKVPSTLYETVA